jgi:sterol desaturase/sphingolipid hydroxylase (fatty acid hydroxylase superfamily)
MWDSSDFSSIYQKLTLHIHNSILFDLSLYASIVGIVCLCVFVATQITRRKRIQSRSATIDDVIRELTSSIRTIICFSIAMSFVVIVEHFGGEVFRYHKISISTLFFQVILLILFHDTYFYWMHRALHSRLLFRSVHFHHHKSVAPTPFAAYSFSVFEAFIEISFVPIFLLSISMIEYRYSVDSIIIFILFMLSRNVVGHAGFELHPQWWVENNISDLLTTTTHHDLHHSHGNCNFGLYFTWWDRLMDTEHKQYKEHFRKNSS